MGIGSFWAAYWWSILPFAGMGIGVLAIVLESRRRKQALDLLKLYIEQGREPPPEVIAALTQDNGGRRAAWSGGTAPASPHNHWPVVIVFAAMALGFGSANFFMTGESRAPFALIAVLFGAMAVGYFFLALFQSRQHGK